MGTARDNRVAIVGGCGHVGLPLGLTFAQAGLRVDLYDLNAESVRTISDGRMPFMEEGGEALLRAHVGKNLRATTDPAVLREADVVVCVIGTPIDEHLNPELDRLFAAVEGLKPFLSGRQLFVLRSTVYPGATRRIAAHLQERIPGIDVAFCPERVAQGKATKEIGSMPQIVAGATARAGERAARLFSRICPKTIPLEPTEAELAKLFCNAWRYISFAVANQFYAACADNGIDYYRVWNAITDDYPRMKGLPTAGFAAGPCLFKDTMQLAAYFENEFSLGTAAMLVNEGMPRHLVRQLEAKGPLHERTVGILGMSFKGDNDDVRESLSFKLRKILKLEAKEVLCTDPFAADPSFLPLETVLARADLLVIGAPHSAYRRVTTTKPVLDPWNLLGRGGLLT